MLDLIVLGAGPAGYLAAERAAQAGYSVVLFEKQRNWRGLPERGLHPFQNTAEFRQNLRLRPARWRKIRLLQRSLPAWTMPLSSNAKAKVVQMLVSGVETTLKKLKVEIVREEARIDGKTAHGFRVAAAGKTWEAPRRLLIATGSQAVIPPIPGVKERAGKRIYSDQPGDIPNQRTSDGNWWSSVAA